MVGIHTSGLEDQPRRLVCPPGALAISSATAQDGLPGEKRTWPDVLEVASEGDGKEMSQEKEKKTQLGYTMRAGLLNFDWELI